MHVLAQVSLYLRMESLMAPRGMAREPSSLKWWALYAHKTLWHSINLADCMSSATESTREVSLVETYVLLTGVRMGTSSVAVYESVYVANCHNENVF